MEFIEREVQYPGKLKLTKVDENNTPIPNQDEILVNITLDEGTQYTQGTPLSAENLNKANYKDNDSLCFTQSSTTSPKSALANQTQLSTTADGKTWLTPPAGFGAAKEIGIPSITQPTYNCSIYFVDANTPNSTNRKEVPSDMTFDVLPLNITNSTGTTIGTKICVLEANNGTGNLAPDAANPVKNIGGVDVLLLALPTQATEAGITYPPIIVASNDGDGVGITTRSGIFSRGLHQPTVINNVPYVRYKSEVDNRLGRIYANDNIRIQFVY